MWNFRFALTVSSFMILVPVLNLLINQAAPITSVDAITLEAGQRFTLTYQSNAPAALIVEPSEILCSVRCLTLHGPRVLWGFMKAYEKRASITFSLPVGTRKATAYFMSMNQKHPYDDRATLKLPIRGASPEIDIPFNTSSSQVRKLLSAHLTKYPRDLLAYLDAWLAYSVVESPASAKNLIEQDLGVLEALPKSAVSTGVLARGYVRVKDTKKAIGICREMMSRWPRHEMTDGAIASLFTSNERNHEVQSLVVDYFSKNPNLSAVRGGFLWFLSTNPKIPLEKVEKIVESWLRDQPEHPQPLLDLASGLLERRVQISRAQRLAQRAVAAANSPIYRATYDIYGKSQRLLLDVSLQTLTKLAIENKDSWVAISAALATKGLGQSQGGVVNELLERAYLLCGATGAAANAAESVPDCKLEMLSGENVPLKSLSSRTVVLNFWFTTCTPCKEEIAALNDLVAEFSMKSDIDFMAITWNDRPTVRQFLEHTKFAYKHAINGTAVAQKFGVTEYPVHFILRDGKIVFRRVGGGVAELRKELQRLMGG